MQENPARLAVASEHHELNTKSERAGTAWAVLRGDPARDVVSKATSSPTGSASACLTAKQKRARSKKLAVKKRLAKKCADPGQLIDKGMVVNGEHFVFADSSTGSDRIILLGTQFSLERLEEAKCCLSNGTSRTVRDQVLATRPGRAIVALHACPQRFVRGVGTFLPIHDLELQTLIYSVGCPRRNPESGC